MSEQAGRSSLTPSQPTAPTTTYAAVLRRTANQSLGLDPTQENHVWGDQDVDRQDNLDDLNPVPPTTTIRSVVANSSAVGGNPPYGSNIITTPNTSRSNRLLSVNNGARMATPTHINARGPNAHSPPTPSPTRVGRMPPEQRTSEPRNQFTLDEMLSNVRPSSAPSARPANQSRPTVNGTSARRRDSVGGFNVLSRLINDIENTRRGRENAQGMTVRQPTALPRPTTSFLRSLPNPSSAALPFTNANSSQSRDTATNDVSGSNNLPTPFPETIFSGISPSDDGTDGDDHTGWATEVEIPDIVPETDWMPVEESEEEDNAMEMSMNVEDEGNGWFRVGRVQLSVDGGGQQEAGANLHRGGNNRRRSVSRPQTQAQTHVVDTAGSSRRTAASQPSHLRLRERRERSLGLPPTNIIDSVPAPLIVSSRGTRRPRPESSSLLPQKKAKLSSSHAKIKQREKRQEYCQNRPAYLSYTTLPKEAALPESFLPLPPKSHLSLSSYNPHLPSQSFLWPCVTFTSYTPNLTHSDLDATSIFSASPIPPDCPIFYYEIKVLQKGEEGFISIGWMENSFASQTENSQIIGNREQARGRTLRRLVGWTPGTWGWHADDGRLFPGTGTGEIFSETWTEGDTVGCGVDWTFRPAKAFFTKNGKMMGYRMWQLPTLLHPAIGLRSPGESVALNFKGPFMFDISSVARDGKERVWNEVRSFGTGIVSSRKMDIVRLVDQIPQSLTEKLNRDPEDQDMQSDLDVKMEMKNGDLNKSKEKQNTKEHLAPTVKDEVKSFNEYRSKNKAPLSSISSPLDPLTRTTTAFVLDYLLHNGHVTSTSSFLKQLSKCSWIPPMPPSALSFITRTQNQPTFNPWTYDDNVHQVDSFGSVEQAMKFMSQLLRSPFEHGVPWRLWKELSLSSDQMKENELEPWISRLLIFDFLHLATHHAPTPNSIVFEPLIFNPTNSSDPPVAKEEEAHLDLLLARGKALFARMRSGKFASTETRNLQMSFGAIADPREFIEGQKWREWREMLSEGIVKFVRDRRGKKPLSHLEAAIAQTHAVCQTLAKVRQSSGAGYIEVKEVLQGSFVGLQEAVSASSEEQTEGKSV
nr:hypothetical protein L204_06155 [Cryptococcus depauperatus CBS 7855]